MTSPIEDKDGSARLQEMYASLSAARFEDELFNDYKERMRVTNRVLRNYMKAR